MAKLRKFKPGVDDYVTRDEFTLKVLEVHGKNEVTIRNQFGFPERVSVEELSAADPDKVAAITKRINASKRN